MARGAVSAAKSHDVGLVLFSKELKAKTVPVEGSALRKYSRNESSPKRAWERELRELGLTKDDNLRDTSIQGLRCFVGTFLQLSIVGGLLLKQSAAALRIRCIRTIAMSYLK